MIYPWEKDARIIKQRFDMNNIWSIIQETAGIRADQDYVKTYLEHHNLAYLMVISMFSIVSQTLMPLIGLLGFPAAGAGAVLRAPSFLPVHYVYMIEIACSTVCFFFAMHAHRKTPFNYKITNAVCLLYGFAMTCYGAYISVYDPHLGLTVMPFLINEMWIFGLLALPPVLSLFVSAFYFISYAHILNMIQYSFGRTICLLLFWVSIYVISVVRYRVSLNVVHEKHRSEAVYEKLEVISRTDALTGLKNRTALNSDFRSFSSAHLYVMMTDIDNFKEYNDSLGHAFGDEILGNFGRCLCSVFGHDDVYRYGGDEFLVIADNYNDETFLKAVNRVRSKFNNCTVGGSCIHATFSAGSVEGACHSGQDCLEMIRQADIRLYKAKDGGKNRLFEGTNPSPGRSEDQHVPDTGPGPGTCQRNEKDVNITKSAPAGQ